MAYDTDTDALIDRLIDRLVEAEKRTAAASYIQAMQQYELMKVEHAEVSRILADRENKRRESLPKLHELWEAADKLLTAMTMTDSAAVNRLRTALDNSYLDCDGIPF